MMIGISKRMLLTVVLASMLSGMMCGVIRTHVNLIPIVAAQDDPGGRVCSSPPYGCNAIGCMYDPSQGRWLCSGWSFPGTPGCNTQACEGDPDEGG